MIDIHFWTTPNGYKILLFAEEAAIPYRLVPVNISTGEQFHPEFLKISPNNRIPAIVDHSPVGAGEPLSIFESGAILQYLANKVGKFGGRDRLARIEVEQWLYWQTSGLGPMAGQNHHFNHYAPEKIPYAIDRYIQETNRLYGVLEKRLRGRKYMVGDDYTIADMACYPWIKLHKRASQDIEQFPSIRMWLELVEARPATARSYSIGGAINQMPVVTDSESRKILFGQTAATLVCNIR
jgi:GST-like protein